MMERKEKIRLLRGIANGTRHLNELASMHDPVVIDDNDNRDFINELKNNCAVVTSTEFEKLETNGSIKGFAVDLRKGKTVLLSFPQ